MSHSPKRLSIQEWLDRIRDKEMPIFGHTVQSIIRVAEDEAASTHQLAQVVLQDASMTTRVLKLVNTTYYKTRDESISTISRAVVVLGFDTVRNICLSISLVDAFVRGNARDHLTHELARAIHSAVQARAIAIEQGDDSPEEIFIATLLYHIGDMAFWCFSEHQAEELDALLQQPDISPEQAQESVLGFRLRELSSKLTQEWHLSPLLNEALNPANRASKRVRSIQLAHTLAEQAEIHGWQANQTKETIAAIAKMNGQDPKDLSQLLHQNAREAAMIATHFGAASAAKAIPVPSQHAHEQAPVPTEATPPPFPEPDGMLQLKIIRELSQMVESSRNFNMIMELVLEGIYRGVGMDRTLFAMVSPDRRELRSKFALGHEANNLNQAFHFLKHPQQPNLFFDLLEQGEEIWFDAQHNTQLRPRVSSAIIRALGGQGFFIAPIIVCGKRIGVFYADRLPSQRPLDQDAFDSFQMMVNQANMGLTHIASKRA
ncbi:MAG: HDOD domain-containing protein [Chromatiales bacterium]|nr:HDOD domain-containing protein [Chromatiales bacterium]